MSDPLALPPGEPGRAVPAGPGATGSGITVSGLDPALAALGQAISLLRPTGDDAYAVSDDWFTDPIAKTRAGFADNRAAVAALLEQVLGQVAGQALGIPVADPALLGTWYPIKDPTAGGAPTGLYLVSYERPDAQDPAKSITVFGLGVLHTWKVPDAAPAVKIEVWGLVPLLLYQGSGLGAAFDHPGFPISLGIAVTSATGKPLIDAHGVQLAGVKVSAGLDLYLATHPQPGASAVDLAIVVLGLELPGESEPRDRSLADLAGITGEQILETASSLFLTAMQQVFPKAGAELGSLLPMLGLSSQVPGSDETLPVLAWYDLFALAAAGKDVSRPFVDWFTALASDPPRLALWLGTVGGFLGSTAPVAGSGTRDDPFVVPVLGSAAAFGVLGFTGATAVDAGGTRSFFPGLSFVGKSFDAGKVAAVRVESALELGQFRLGGQGIAFGSPSSLAFSSFLRLTGAGGGPLLDAGGFKIGSVQAGGTLTFDLELVPLFMVLDVESPTGNFASLDLLAPGELAEAAEEVLVGAVSAGLEQLLGLSASAATFVDSVAALLGIQPPALAAGETWPAALAPPLSPGQLAATVADPLGALGRYWQAVATSSAAVAPGVVPLEVMVRAAAAMLVPATGGTASITVVPVGDPPHGWSVTLTVAGSKLPVSLVVTRSEPAAGITRLTFGLAAAPELTLQGVRVVPALATDVVRLDLPAVGNPQPFSAAWAPSVGASLALPDGLSTPPVAGVKVALSATRFAAGWSLAGGWSWSLVAGSPVLQIDGQPDVPLGESLDFSNQTSWKDLIEQGGATFSPLLVSAVGLALARSGTRAGLAVTGLLGLLPDVSKVAGFPSGLTWPAIPQLAVPDLTDPVPALRQRVATDFSVPANATAVLSLLDWAIHGQLTAARKIAGEGRFAAPWRVPLGAPAAGPAPAAGTGGYELTSWYDPVGGRQVIGAGLACSSVSAFGPLRVTVDTRLAFFEVSLASGARVAGRAPGLALLVTVERPGGALVDGGASGSLGSVQVGFTLGLDEAAGTLVLAPQVNLFAVTLPGESQQAELTLADFLDPSFTSRLEAAFVALLDTALQAAFAQVAANPTFQRAYRLLTLLGLVLERGKAGDPYGIRASGWRGLLSDPASYAADQLAAVLAEPAQRSELFSFVEDLLGITLPPVPAPVLELLTGLDVLGSAAQGYPLRPQALVALAGNPLGELQRRFEALIGDAERLRALASALAASVAPATIGKPQPFGIFTLTATSQTRLELSVAPAQAIEIGGFLAISGSVSFDIASATLGAAVAFSVPTVGLSVVPSLAWRLGGGAPQIAVDLVWGDPSLPAAPPVRIYPFAPGPFVDQLAVVAPAYALSVIATGILESQLVARYPFVQELFTGLGIAQRDAAGNWQMPALVGLLEDPARWLLSNRVLGADGRFDLAVFGKLLAALPAVEDPQLGVGVRPIAGGVQVYGLPYGIGADVTATSSLAQITVATTNLPVAGGYAEVQKLSTTLQLDAEYQPGIAGSLELATGSAAPARFFVAAGYDRGFLLTVGAGSPGAPGALALRLVPFLGWGSLAAQLVQYAPQVVQKLMRELFAQRNPGQTDPFLTALEKAGGLLDVQSLIDAVVHSIQDGKPEQIGPEALDWLAGRVSGAQLPSTVQALGAVFQASIPAVQVSAGGLISYTPSKELPLTILLGVQTLGGVEQLGVWVRLALPPTALLRVGVQDTGIGLALPLGKDPKPLFRFGVELTLPIDGEIGPSLALGLAPSGGVALTFDPLGDASGGPPSTLSRELLPRFFGGPPDLGKAVEEWVVGVLTNVLPRYVSVVILNQATVKSWLETPIVAGSPGAPTPLTLLTATSLVVESGGILRLNSLEELSKLTVEGFVADFLYTLLQTRIRVLSFKTSSKATTAKGEIWIEPDPQDANAFGFRIVAPDLEIPGLSRIVLQLGAEDTKWIEESGSTVPGAAARGLAAYVPLSGTGSARKPHFDQLKLGLVNVGVDFTGSESKPLVDKPRFRLAAVEPRALLTLALAGAGAPQVELGGALTLQGIGISVAPNSLVQGDGGNPVASNLLGSGADGGGSTPPANPPTNPTFSVSAAFSKTLWVDLESSTGNGHEVVIPVERTFGPLHVSKLGIGWETSDKVLSLLFGGGVDLLGLSASVQQLTVGIPVETLSQLDSYTLDLQGLDVSFAGGPVQLAGAFLKQTDPLNYIGGVSVRAAAFNVAAAGAYGVVDGAPSLFIFGALTDRPLGGPPAFFVTGIALGFGFNRNLLLPDVAGVYEWPLIKGVREGSFTSSTTPEEGLEALARVVSPAVGEYWMAAGLQFTTFALLKTFALLTLRIGREIEVALLGVMSASLPPQVNENQALAYLELALAVVFKPQEGVLSAQAQLTPNSFVLVRECKVTGGFAAFFWFREIETSSYTVPAGQFVISLGGYHPSFQAPPYYPVVPRLGLSWKVEVSVGRLSIDGGAYFALVPTAVMAGGYLKATFVAGPLSAWLQAAANFLIEWKPFYYSVDIAVQVGAQFHTTIAGVSVTLRAALGASLYLAGPKTHGSVEVDWYVISFTIPFGSGEQATSDSYLATWEDFAADFLPPPEAGGQQVVKLRVASGLLADTQPADGGPTARAAGADPPPWKLSPVPFELGLDTAVPISALTVAGTTWSFAGNAVGVRPMNRHTALASPAVASLLDAEGRPVDLVARGLDLVPILTGAPGALWARSKLSREYAPNANDMLVEQALVGLTLSASKYLLYGDVPAFPLEALRYEDGTRYQLPFAVSPKFPPAQRYGAADQDRALSILMGSIMSAPTVAARNAVLAALAATDLTAPASPDLSVMASSASLILVARPVLARIGIYQTGTASGARRINEPARSATPASPTSADAAGPPVGEPASLRPPQVRSVLRRYRLTAAAGDGAGGAAVPAVRGVWVDRSEARPSRLLAAFARRAGSGEPSPALHAGTHVLWELDPAGRHGVEHRGALPLRFSVYDRYHALLAYWTSGGEAAGGGDAELPPGAAFVLAQGCAEGAPGPVCGWQAASVLARIDPYHAVGEGVIVRPQNHVRRRRRHREEQRGQIAAEALLAGNLVESRGGLVAGWVQSVFERPFARFAVAVDCEAGNEPALRVTALRGGRPEAFSSEALEPVARFAAGGSTLLVFEAPPPREPAGGLSVLAQPLAATTRLAGVHAFDPSGEEAARRGELVAQAAALDPALGPAPGSAGREPAASRVRILLHGPAAAQEAA